jgi:hypothetical protein
VTRSQDGAPLGNPGVRRLAVFSHPGHELAVFGFVQRVRPTLLYLTDGVGEARQAETRRGLESIGMAERMRFLSFGEDAFYAALLARDAGYFRRVADAVRAEIEAAQVEEVLCDAVEFYNPVHDMTLPLVLAALQGRNDVAVFELPVVYQRPEPGEVCETHRFPDPDGPGQVVLRLTDEELAAKLRARDDIYDRLRAQVPELVAVSAAQAAAEVVRRSDGSVPRPDASRVLRYERRGRLLQEQGAVEQVITYADHFAPIVSLLGLH